MNLAEYYYQALLVSLTCTVYPLFGMVQQAKELSHNILYNQREQKDLLMSYFISSNSI